MWSIINDYHVCLLGNAVQIYAQNNKLSDLRLMYIAQSSQLLKLMEIELN